MITFQVEDYAAVIEEIKPYLQQHSDELGAHNGAAIDPDFEEYARLAADDMLHIVTARREGELIGYHVSFVTMHYHHKNSITAYSDLYYLRKDCRRGWLGIRLLKFVDKTLAARGVTRVFTSTSTAEDNSTILRRLGYTETQRTFMKVIGEQHV